MENSNENMKKEGYKNFFKSKTFKATMISLGVLIVILLVLQIGIRIGFRKAGFSFHEGENYYRVFGNHQQKNHFPFMKMGVLRDDFPVAHGATGKIIQINLPTFVVEDMDHTEKIILAGDKTTVRSFREDWKLTDLKIDDFVTVIGSPNENGQIEARLIRIMPPPPSGFPALPSPSGSPVK
jgi:hypothetical protein